jgi:hypothetical protein
MRFLIVFLLLVLLVWQCSQFGYRSTGGFPTRAAAHAKAVEHLHFWYYLITRNTYKVEYYYLENGDYKHEAMWYFKDKKQVGLEEDFGSGYSKLWPGITRSKLKQLTAQTHQGASIDSLLGQTILP